MWKLYLGRSGPNRADLGLIGPVWARAGPGRSGLFVGSGRKSRPGPWAWAGLGPAQVRAQHYLADVTSPLPSDALLAGPGRAGPGPGPLSLKPSPARPQPGPAAPLSHVHFFTQKVWLPI